MNKVTIQIVMLAACVTLANPALRADEPAKATPITVTPMSEVVEQTLRPVFPHDACSNKLYELAKAACTTHEPKYTQAFHTAFDACVEKESHQLFGKKRDTVAQATCLSKAVMKATQKGDPDTMKFLIARTLNPNSEQKNPTGPTVSATLYSPLDALFGATKYGLVGAVAGAALCGAFAGGHNWNIWWNSSTTTTTTTRGNPFNLLTWFGSTTTQTTTNGTGMNGKRWDIGQMSKCGALAGGSLGAVLGTSCGIKISFGMR
ncbi:MAG: hypothetical protein IT346_00830 [Epsilonproteobacteria bacterium]|nr:hypothetical protein [Campylobacterota bacterium]